MRAVWVETPLMLAAAAQRIRTWATEGHDAAISGLVVHGVDAPEQGVASHRMLTPRRLYGAGTRAAVVIEFAYASRARRHRQGPRGRQESC